MDRTKIIVVLSLGVASGCSLRRPIPPFKLANEATSPTEPAPLAPVDPLTLEPASVQVAVQSYQRSGKAPVISGERTLYPYELTRKPPALVCAPLHVTDLTL